MAETAEESWATDVLEAWQEWADGFSASIAQVREGVNAATSEKEAGAGPPALLRAAGVSARVQVAPAPAAQTMSNGVAGMTRALEMMRGVAAGAKGRTAEALEKEHKVAQSIVESLRQVVERVLAGVPLHGTDVEYDLAMYNAVWQTHAFLPV